MTSKETSVTIGEYTAISTSTTKSMGSIWVLKGERLMLHATTSGKFNEKELKEFLNTYIESNKELENDK